MGFILDGLETEAYDRTYRDRDLTRRVIGYFRPFRAQVLLVALTLTLNSVAGSGGPIIISRSIDVLAADPSLARMLALCGLALGVGVFAWVCNFIQQRISARVIGDVVLQLRQDVFAATANHDLSFFEEHPSGKIVSRITSDTQDFSDVVSLVVNLVSQVLLVGFLMVWLLRVHVGLTLLLLLMSPVAAAIALSFRRIARAVTQRARRVTAKINAQIQESISGIMVAKAFRQEHAIYQTFEANNRQAYRVGIQRGLTLDTIFPIMGIASGLGVALLIFLGGLRVRSGAISPGNWYLYMQAVSFFWWPLMNIASFWSQFQDGLSAAERVFGLIDADSKVIQRGADPVERIAGRITFRHVHFSYTGTETVLPDFSLDIRAGESVALVGHTGAGKSSVANLIARFYEFQAGELLIDGRDIRSLNLRDYRQHIGLVPQDPFLFSGTVRENIHYGRENATPAEVVTAAMRISNGEWIAGLPDGLESDAGERGANLSMGQRQLVALARVLLKAPSVLILDEATASVDPFTESQIQEGLEQLLHGRTSIVIAHRLSTVRRADRILVMDHGRILDEGTHETLLARGGHYAELYNAYFRHQSLEALNRPVWLREPHAAS